MESNRQSAMKNLMAADFVAYELQLYLDTHPNDKEAMEKYTDAVSKAAVLRTEYENQFGPITAASAAGKLPWQWITSPWNWQ
jgi:spore coat protein JB